MLTQDLDEQKVDVAGEFGDKDRINLSRRGPEGRLVVAQFVTVQRS